MEGVYVVGGVEAVAVGKASRFGVVTERRDIGVITVKPNFAAAVSDLYVQREV